MSPRMSPLSSGTFLKIRMNYSIEGSKVIVDGMEFKSMEELYEAYDKRNISKAQFDFLANILRRITYECPRG